MKLGGLPGVLREQGVGVAPLATVLALGMSLNSHLLSRDRGRLPWLLVLQLGWHSIPDHRGKQGQLPS